MEEEERTPEDLHQKRYWIALNLLPELGPRRVQALLRSFESPREIFEAPPERIAEIPELKRFASRWPRMCREALHEAEAELSRLKEHKLSALTLADPDYPKPLRALDDPPPVLYVRGTYESRDELAIAIVGTRRPSSYGRRVAERLARELGAMGFTIVSGLARGIDTAAHRGALKAGARTIAVLGGGFAHFYPQENRRLGDEIAGSGAVLSEFPVELPPDRWTFPRRNRVISGLSRGTIVVEAPERSGALITARLALEQGREVFAVPGPITQETSAGVHKLIQQGAKLITDVDDVLEEFADLKRTLSARRGAAAPAPAMAGRPQPQSQPQLSPLEQGVLNALEFDPLHFNDVVERTRLSPSEVSLALLQLVMKGLVEELEGKRYAKLP